MKNILLHTVPVLALALGAIFGLTAEEQTTFTQAVTSIISSVFAILAIWMHYKKTKKVKEQ